MALLITGLGDISGQAIRISETVFTGDEMTRERALAACKSTQQGAEGWQITRYLDQFTKRTLYPDGPELERPFKFWLRQYEAAPKERIRYMECARNGAVWIFRSRDAEGLHIISGQNPNPFIFDQPVRFELLLVTGGGNPGLLSFFVRAGAITVEQGNAIFEALSTRFGGRNIVVYIRSDSWFVPAWDNFPLFYPFEYPESGPLLNTEGALPAGMECFKGRCKIVTY